MQDARVGAQELVMQKWNEKIQKKAWSRACLLGEPKHPHWITHTDPIPKREKMKTDDLTLQWDTLVKPAKPRNVPPKNGDQTKTINTYSETPTVHAFHFQDWHFCLYLSIFDCLRCPPLTARHLFMSHTHPCGVFLCGLWATSVPVRTEGSWPALC